MAATHPLNTPSPTPAVLNVDTSGLGSTPMTRRALCRAYVERVLRLTEVDYVALWVRDGLMHLPGHSGYELAMASPDMGTRRRIPLHHEIAEWAASAGAFGWTVSDVPILSLMDAPDFGPGVSLVFAQEEQILLCIHIITEHAEIGGIQSSLVELAGFLNRRQSEAAPVAPERAVVVDVGFLEAMAMGDEAFVIHMLQMCVEQIEDGTQSLSEAVLAGDAPKVAHVAHKLRSTVRTVGAERLDQLLERVEQAADAGTIIDVRETVLGCEQAVGAILTLLSQRK